MQMQATVFKNLLTWSCGHFKKWGCIYAVLDMWLRSNISLQIFDPTICCLYLAEIRVGGLFPDIFCPSGGAPQSIGLILNGGTYQEDNFLFHCPLSPSYGGLWPPSGTSSFHHAPRWVIDPRSLYWLDALIDQPHFLYPSWIGWPQVNKNVPQEMYKGIQYMILSSWNSTCLVSALGCTWVNLEISDIIKAPPKNGYIQ